MAVMRSKKRFVSEDFVERLNFFLVFSRSIKEYIFMILSKSEYMMYLKHPAWLWVKKHAKDRLIPPVSPELQARFDEGNQFEPI